MCRNIKTLFNFEPPATEDEIHASALQFVRKLSGFNKPSQANAAAFDLARSRKSPRPRENCSTSLNTHAPARDRDGRGREGAGAGTRALCVSSTLFHTKPIRFTHRSSADCVSAASAVAVFVRYLMDPADHYRATCRDDSGRVNEMRIIRNHVAHANAGTRQEYSTVVGRRLGAVPARPAPQPVASARTGQARPEGYPVVLNHSVMAGHSPSKTA